MAVGGNDEVGMEQAGARHAGAGGCEGAGGCWRMLEGVKSVQTSPKYVASSNGVTTKMVRRRHGQVTRWRLCRGLQETCCARSIKNRVVLATRRHPSRASAAELSPNQPVEGCKGLSFPAGLPRSRLSLSMPQKRCRQPNTRRNCEHEKSPKCCSFLSMPDFFSLPGSVDRLSWATS